MSTRNDATSNKPVTTSKIVGIDLGTSNSLLAVLEAANPTIVPNLEGMRSTPSIVAFTSKGDTLVGQLAKRQTMINTENTFYSVKRFIGCTFNEVAAEIGKVSYRVERGEAGNVRLKCPALSKSFSPEEISSFVLKKLADDASRYLKQPITQAIITVPAYFNDSQRQSTKDAGSIAGLEVLRILNEPTAAALAYGINQKKNEVVLIFDLGGGTFDVSILEVGNEVFEVLSTSGDTHLGGDDFDSKIFSEVLNTFKTTEGIDLYQDKQAMQRILEAAEKAKIELSSMQSTRISCPFICIDGQTPKHIDFQLDRSRFESLSRDLLDRCKGPVEKALADAKLSKEQIDQVILVGGSTRIPAVKDLLTSLLDKPLNQSVNPDEVVALGAAVQAGVLSGQITDIILLDVTPLSLGVETMGGLFTTIISRNSSIPAKQTESFSTATDLQDTVEIHVLQGERALAKDNKSLGIFSLQKIPPAPKGVPKIDVTFQLNVDGILIVEAKEEKTGQQQSIRIEGASVLGNEELEQILKQAEKSSFSDKGKKIVINVAYSLSHLLDASEIYVNKNPATGNNSSYSLYKNQNILRLLKFLIATIKAEYRLGKLSNLLQKLSQIAFVTKYISTANLIKKY